MLTPIVSHNEKLEPSHIGVLTGTIIVKNLDSNNIGGLRNTAVECTRARKYLIKRIMERRLHTIDWKRQSQHSGSHVRFRPLSGIRRFRGKYQILYFS